MLLSQGLFYSCTEVVDDPIDDGGEEQVVNVVFSASISPLQSKATNNSFELGDAISVTAYQSDAIYDENVLYSSDGSVFESQAPISLPEDGSSLSYRAIYPYVVMDDGFVEFSIMEDQSGDDYYSSDLMSSYLAATSLSSPSLTFNHVLSSVVVNLSSQTTLVDVDALFFSPLSVSYNAIDDETTSKGDLYNVVMADNGSYSYKAIVAPQTFSEGDVIATISISEVDYQVVCPYDITLESGCQYTFDFAVEDPDDPAADIEITFEDLQISDWGDGFSIDLGVTLSSIDGAMNNLYDTLVEVFGASTSAHYDFAYPSLMITFDNMSANMISACGDGNSGYNWFSSSTNGSGLGSDYSRTWYIWTTYQNFITATNDIITTVAISGDDSTDAISYLAAAKSFRAMFYLDMARLYEPLPNNYLDVSAVEGLTVPYISESTTESELANNPRLTRDEIFEKIFADLDDAEAMYTTSGVEAVSARVPNLAATYGLKARAYLWLGGFDPSYYTLAAEYARKAINTSSASIMSQDDYCDPKNGFNTPNSSWMLYMAQIAATNAVVNYTSWLASEAPYGYGYLVGMGTSSANYERMSSTDFRKRLFLSDSPNYSDYSDITLRSSSDFSNAYPYSSFKIRPRQGDISNYSSGCAASIPLMRIEEMYFIEAEATAHSSAASGVQLLNNFMANRDSSYSFSSYDTDTVVEEIVFQKSIELWGEGIYLFDAKRLGLGIYLAYEGTNAASDCTFNIEGVAPWWNIPFPGSAISSNSALEGLNNPDPSDIYTSLLENY